MRVELFKELVLGLVGDDALAITFQSFASYRTHLLKAIRAIDTELDIEFCEACEKMIDCSDEKVIPVEDYYLCRECADYQLKEYEERHNKEGKYESK